MGRTFPDVTGRKRRDLIVLLRILHRQGHESMHLGPRDVVYNMRWYRDRFLRKYGTIKADPPKGSRPDYVEPWYGRGDVTDLLTGKVTKGPLSRWLPSQPRRRVRKNRHKEVLDAHRLYFMGPGRSW